MSRVLPILFNTEMVRAILDGRKTVTRRLVSNKIARGFELACDGTPLYYTNEKGDCWHALDVAPWETGDILYVRETWGVENVYGNSGVFGFDAVYKAGEQIHPVIIKDFDRYSDIGKFFDKDGWIPSIHMPKEAARIWLKVTDVRVERLQDITEEQVLKEGIHPYEIKNALDFACNDRIIAGQVCFSRLWISTLKKDAIYTWAHNPWVWVIEFERCEKPEGIA